MSDYGSDSYYFAGRQRGGGRGGAPSAPASSPPPSIHPSGGGGGGGGGIRIAPGGGGGGGAVPASRPQKTQVLNHLQQTAVGGPGAPTPPHGIPPNPTVPSGVPPPTPPTSTAPPHPGMPGGGIGGEGGPQIHPGIGGEHQGPGIPGEHGGGARLPSQRDERAHPDQFRDWDRRFDQDRDHLHADYWRTAFSDYDRDRFLPWIGEDHLLWHIFGINYYPQYVNVGIPYYPVDCGTWVIGADGRWYLVSQSQLSIISQIESLRGIRRYRPVVIPCGWGGGWI